MATRGKLLDDEEWIKETNTEQKKKKYNEAAKETLMTTVTGEISCIGNPFFVYFNSSRVYEMIKRRTRDLRPTNKKNGTTNTKYCGEWMFESKWNATFVIVKWKPVKRIKTVLFYQILSHSLTFFALHFFVFVFFVDKFFW